MVDTLPQLRRSLEAAHSVDLQFTLSKRPSSNGPNHLFAADVLLAESRADVDQPPVPTNAVVATDVANLEIESDHPDCVGDETEANHS